MIIAFRLADISAIEFPKRVDFLSACMSESCASGSRRTAGGVRFDLIAFACSAAVGDRSTGSAEHSA